jgi:hypothetical protein
MLISLAADAVQGEKEAAEKPPSVSAPATTATEVKQTHKVPKTDRPIYKPPLRGAPSSRVGGGTRGEEGDSIALTVLAPGHTGWSASDQPTLYWYLSKPANTRLELTVIDDDAIKPLLETQLLMTSRARHPGAEACGTWRSPEAAGGISMVRGLGQGSGAALHGYRFQRNYPLRPTIGGTPEDFGPG